MNRILFVGLIAGVFSGMFGIGGGVVIVPALTLLLQFDLKAATGTSLAALLMDEEPERGMIVADLAADTGHNMVVPVMFGSATTGGGVRRLMKLLRHETPRPDAAAARLGLEQGGAFHVFKIANGGAMGRLALGRVLGGSLKEGEELLVAGEAARTGSLFALPLTVLGTALTLAGWVMTRLADRRPKVS